MADPRVVEAGEMDAETLLATLKREARIVVRTEFVGSQHEVTLRWDGETFYCDTPTRLHKHESEQEMQACLEEQGYSQ